MAGNQLDGEVGFIYRKTIAGFSLLQSAIRDEQDRTNEFVTANYTLTPSWQLRSGFESFDLNHSTLSDRDHSENTGRLGVRYSSRAKNTLDLEGLFTDGGVPNRIVPLTGNPDTLPGAGQSANLDNDFQ